MVLPTGGSDPYPPGIWSGGDIRVFLCDDVSAFRQLLRFVLEEHDDIVVVGEASDGAAGVTGVEAEQPDVILLDLAMPGCDGLTALPRMHAAAPGTQVIVLSGFTIERMGETARRAGAAGYLEKGAELADIVAEVRRAGLAAHALRAA